MYDARNKQLRFNTDGRFRILMISDFHAGSRRKGFEDGNPYSPKIKEAIEALVVETNPDFVMVGGDQCIGKSEAYLYNSFCDIMQPVLSRNIPWAHVYGNHDRECELTLPNSRRCMRKSPTAFRSRDPRIFSVCAIM